MLETILQVSFGFFRGVLFLYWTIVVLYTSVVLICIYIYQFPDIPELWFNATHLSKAWNDDIGLINYDNEHGDGTAELFVKLIAPISFLTVAILQLKFFHGRWLQVTDMESAAVQRRSADPKIGASPSSGRSDMSYLKIAHGFLRETIEVLWRLAEIHIGKLIALVLIIIAVDQVCAINFVLVVLVSLALAIPALHWLVCLFGTAYLALISLARMVYQMHFLANATERAASSLTKDCDFLNGTEPTSVNVWFGLHHSSMLGSYLAGFIVALLLLAAQAVIKYRQRYVRTARGEVEPPTGVVFPEVERQHADDGLTNCAKFLLNHVFYKFGLELCYIMMVIVAWARMDLVAAIIVIWLFAFAFLSRTATKRLWFFLLIFLAVLLPLQYALAVGLPPTSCIHYPWRLWFAEQFGDEGDGAVKVSNMIMWLDLPDYLVPPRPSLLVGDFFLLLFVACQAAVFRREHDEHPGGSNKAIIEHGYELDRSLNPHRDFVTYQRNFLDFFKMAIFLYGHWITWIMVFVAGLGGTSLFALGYLVIAFAMLWRGNDLFLLPMHAILRKWHALLLYNIFAIFCKVSLQVVGCVFVRGLDGSCWVRQLLSVVCVNPRAYPFGGFDKECLVEQAETMIGFDALCFVFVIFQLRILQSWYFQHCILEFRTERVLSSRGAVLVNQLIQKEMIEQDAEQRAKFDEIKERTALIRQRYNLQQIKGEEAFEPKTYAQ
uniref:Piezo domain-containing protein n=1 Tax=Plectus sambesii TaxID=2011161 RepID=A0A914XDQ8_9BILA